MKRITVTDYITSGGEIREVYVSLPEGEVFAGEQSFWLSWEDFDAIRLSGQVLIDGIELLVGRVG